MSRLMRLGAASGHQAHPCQEKAASSREGGKAKRCSLREPGTLLEPLDPVVLLLLPNSE